MCKSFCFCCEVRFDNEFGVCETQNEWVISRVFQKQAEKMHISSLMKLGSGINQFKPVGLPPLMDSSPYLKSGRGDTFPGSLFHATCFSGQATEAKSHFSVSKDECNLTMFGSSSTHLIPNVSSVLHSDPMFIQR